jgi:hypothetical protein
MSIELDDVVRLLEASDIAYKKSIGDLELHVEVTIETPAVRSPARMVFSVSREGRLFTAEIVNFVPKEVMGKLVKSRDFLLELLNLGWRTALGTYKVYAKAGFLRFVVALPLEDSNLTEAQFKALTEALMDGARAVCELASKILGEGWGRPEPSLLEKVMAAEELIFGDGGSDEDSLNAVNFLIALAGDESAPTDERMVARKIVSTMKKDLKQLMENRP